MKRVIKIEANDGDSRVTIVATLNSTKALCASERSEVVKQLKRSLANAIKGLSYTDFGVENTRVR